MYSKVLVQRDCSIALASISWISYVVWKVRQDPTRWKSWGFRTDNLRQVFIWPSVLFAWLRLAMVWYAMLFLLFMYPGWGILQQFLVQALGVDNLIKIFPQHGL
ncbi:hypothetical protein PJI16_06835 [Nitrospira sp. MA-1]|nr:hypothetical protein [Nitrospira sp. MA-1]